MIVDGDKWIPVILDDMSQRHNAWSVTLPHSVICGRDNNGHPHPLQTGSNSREFEHCRMLITPLRQPVREMRLFERHRYRNLLTAVCRRVMSLSVNGLMFSNVPLEPATSLAVVDLYYCNDRIFCLPQRHFSVKGLKGAHTPLNCVLTHDMSRCSQVWKSPKSYNAFCIPKLVCFILVVPQYLPGVYKFLEFYLKKEFFAHFQKFENYSALRQEIFSVLFIVLKILQKIQNYEISMFRYFKILCLKMILRQYIYLCFCCRKCVNVLMTKYETYRNLRSNL